MFRVPCSLFTVVLVLRSSFLHSLYLYLSVSVCVWCLSFTVAATFSSSCADRERERERESERLSVCLSVRVAELNSGDSQIIRRQQKRNDNQPTKQQSFFLSHSLAPFTIVFSCQCTVLRTLYIVHKPLHVFTI